MANSGRMEEAIEAYSTALQIKPNYVRARYNVGVCCLNMQCYQQAAEHFIEALNLLQIVERTEHSQADSFEAQQEPLAKSYKLEELNISVSLWSALRRAFTLMDRPDLAEQAFPNIEGVNIFQKEFNF